MLCIRMFQIFQILSLARYKTVVSLTIVLPVLRQHLIELRCGHQKQNRCHRAVKTFRPLLTLRSLPSNINKDKWNVLQFNFKD